MNFTCHGRRVALFGVIWWIAVLLPAFSGGCGKTPAFLRDPVERVERGKDAMETIREGAGEAKRHIEKAKAAARTSTEEVRSAATMAARVPKAEPFVRQLTTSADRLERKVAPDLDQALKRVEHIETAGADLLPLATAAGDLAQERDRWQKEAARQKERADSAVRKWLLLTAAGGFAGILAGGALFVWLSRKAGLTVGLASLAVFVVSIALYRWFEWFAWGGLVLILLTVAGLGYGLWRNRRAFRAVVLGGQNVKDAFAEGVRYTKEEIRRLFNLVHATAQEDAGGGVERMVDDVKNGKG